MRRAISEMTPVFRSDIAIELENLIEVYLNEIEKFKL